MNTVIISGSHRVNSQSFKVSNYLKNQLQNEFKASVEIINLATQDLPFWDDSFWGGDSKWQNTWKPIQEKLLWADSVIIVSPEWNGTVPAKLVNFFHFTRPQDLGHKPALIVGISASRGGAYPVSELRSFSSKNNYMCYIPNHVIIRDVGKVLNDDLLDEANKSDFYIKNKITNSLQILSLYSKVFTEIRQSEFLEYEKYPNGM